MLLIPSLLLVFIMLACGWVNIILASFNLVFSESLLSSNVYKQSLSISVSSKFHYYVIKILKFVTSMYRYVIYHTHTCKCSWDSQDTFFFCEAVIITFLCYLLFLHLGQSNLLLLVISALVLIWFTAALKTLFHPPSSLYKSSSSFFFDQVDDLIVPYSSILLLLYSTLWLFSLSVVHHKQNTNVEKDITFYEKKNHDSTAARQQRNEYIWM